MKPVCLEPVLCQQEKPTQQAACARQLESSPHSPQLEKAQAQQQRPNAAKNGQMKFTKFLRFKKYFFKKRLERLAVSLEHLMNY